MNRDRTTETSYRKRVLAKYPAARYESVMTPSGRKYVVVLDATQTAEEVARKYGVCGTAKHAWQSTALMADCPPLAAR